MSVMDTTGGRNAAGPDDAAARKTAGRAAATAADASEDETLDLDKHRTALTEGVTPAEVQADDETRAPEEEGGDNPRPDV